MKRVYQIGAHLTREHRLFGAATLLMDRIVPAVEEVILPPAASPAGSITIELHDGTSRLPGTRQGWRALRQRLRHDPEPAPVVEPIVDMRHSSPGNFSHLLMIHLPLCVAAAEAIGTDPLVVLPWGIPSFVRQAFDLCGFATVATDGPVMGRLCSVAFSDVNSLKHATVSLMRDRAERMRAAFRPDAPRLPSKVFVARRGTRALANQAEVEAMLAPRGYQTVYPEDLSVADQFRLFDEATHVVGVHGAGLSPVGYRSPERAPITVIELLPASHMTNYFRVVIDLIGGHYAAVRGRITSADAAAAYEPGPYVANSLAAFSVEPRSLECALTNVRA